MSTPYDPNQPESNQPENRFGGESHGISSNPYGATNHPEDQPQYGAGAENTTASNNNFSEQLPAYSGVPTYSGNDNVSANGAYGAGNAAGYGTLAGNGQQNLVQGSGKLEIGRAISWAFKAVFANAKVWILGALAYVVIAAILGTIVQGIVGIALLFLMPFVLRMALRQIDEFKPAWGQWKTDVNYWPTFLVSLIVGIISGVIVTVFMLPGLGSVMALINMDSEPSNSDIIAALAPLFGFLGLAMIVSLLINPLLMFMQWSASDSKIGVGQAMKEGFDLGKRNYGSTLLLSLAVGFIVVVGSTITFGLGTIVLLPFSILAQAHAFRQIAGRGIPAAV